MNPETVRHCSISVVGSEDSNSSNDTSGNKSGWVAVSVEILGDNGNKLTFSEVLVEYSFMA